MMRYLFLFIVFFSIATSAVKANKWKLYEVVDTIPIRNVGKKKALKDNTRETYTKTIEILEAQIEKLIKNEIRGLKIKEQVDNFSYLQTQESLENSKILVVDYNYLLPELKDSTTEEIKSFLEFTYGYSVLIIDGSRQNIAMHLKEYKPVYFI